MSKVTKTNMAITVDSWIYNWIGEQDGKRSTIVNKILKDHIIAAAEEPRRQKTLIELTPAERDRRFEAHMRRIYDEIGHPGGEE